MKISVKGRKQLSRYWHMKFRNIKRKQRDGSRLCTIDGQQGFYSGWSTKNKDPGEEQESGDRSQNTHTGGAQGEA